MITHDTTTRELCTNHDAFLVDNGDSERYCSAARIIQTCQFQTVVVGVVGGEYQGADSE